MCRFFVLFVNLLSFDRCTLLRGRYYFPGLGVDILHCVTNNDPLINLGIICIWAVMHINFIFLSLVCYTLSYLMYISMHNIGAITSPIVCPFALEFCLLIMLNMNLPHTSKEKEALL